MTNRQEQLTPAGCDLRDFPFMPLDVVRLRDSDISALSSGDEFRCAVLLWCASWHQVPAASLPDDDVVLSQLAGYGRVVKEWKRVREGALRGWIKCTDGRLYHPVVAEKANEAWQAKLNQRWKTECARIKKHNQRNGTNISIPEFEDFASQFCPSGHSDIVPGDNHTLSPCCPSGNGLQGTGIGTETGTVKEKDKAANTNDRVSGETNSPPPDRPVPRTVPRTVQLATLLRKHGAAVTHANPPLMEWAERGVTDDQALLALDLARRRREEAGSLQPVNAGFLDSILRGEVLKPKTEKPSRHHGIAETDFREGVTEDGRF